MKDFIWFVGSSTTSISTVQSLFTNRKILSPSKPLTTSFSFPFSMPRFSGQLLLSQGERGIEKGVYVGKGVVFSEGVGLASQGI